MRNLREWLFRKWYWYVNNVDKKADVLFMNFGYSNGDTLELLSPAEEKNRYSIQLYHLLANSIDLKDKNIVEVGCGRGGGLAYVTSSFEPSSAQGLDLDKHAVAFSNSYYDLPNMSFVQGDALNLPFETGSCDVVMNVESSHRYPDMNQFLSEVKRVLKPGGHFLFTDFRYDHEIEGLKTDLHATGLKVLKEEDITNHVVTSLEKDDERRRILIKRLAPWFLHGVALNFAGTVGSSTYNQFNNREYVYMNYVFQKSN